MADLNVAIKLRLDGQSGVVKGVEDVTGGFVRMRRSARDAVADVAHLGGALLVFNSLAGPVRDAARAIDAFGAAASRIDLVTRSARESAAVQAQLFGVAQASRVQYTELAEVYARLARAAGNLGVSQSRMLAVTQSISQAMTIGGGSAESMRAALVQLGQGLASGTLRGEELNSILEQTPRLAQAIADGMGVGVGELRKLGEQGRLTAQQIVGALEKEAPRLAQEFARIAPTLGSAFTVLKDGAARAFVEFDKGAGASRALAEAMMSLGRSLGEAGAAAREFGETYGGALKAVGEVGGFLLAAAAAEKLLGLLGRLAAYAKNPLVIGVTLTVAAFEATKAAVETPGFLGWQLKGAEKDLAELSALRARGMRAGEEALFDGLERRLAAARARVDSLKRDLSAATEKARRDSPEFKAEQARFANAGSFRAQEIADMNAEAGGGIPFPGAKPLAEVREYVKTALSIQEDWNAKAVALAESYANAIAAAEGPRADALARQRDAELSALADKAGKELAGLSGAKDAEALAKARLDGQLALEKAGAEARLEALKASHAAGLLGEEEYTRAVLAETGARLQAEYALLQKQYAAAPDAAAREQALTKMREAAIALARAQGQAEADLAAIERKRAAESLERSRQGAQAAAKEYEEIARQLEARRREGEEIGLTQEQLAALNLARMDEAIRLKETAIEQAAAERGREAEAALMREQLGLLRDLRAQTAGNQARALAERQAKEIADEYARAFESIQSALTDAIFDGGENGLKGVEDLVKRYAKAFAAEFIVRPLIQPVFAGAAGLMGVDMSRAGGSWAQMGGGGGLGGIGNLFSTGNSLMNAVGGGGFFGGFSAGAASVASELALGSAFVGPSATLASGSVGLGASLAAGTGSAAGASAVSGLGSALPWIGLGLGALALFGGDLFGKKAKPPVLNMSQFAPGAAPWGIPLETPWGDLRFAGKHMGDTEAAVGQIRDAYGPIAQRDYAISALLSRQENQAIAQAIAGMSTGETKDYSEEALRAFFARRLGYVSDIVGGWVDEVADRLAGSLEDSYATLATLLAGRGREGFDAFARDFAASIEDGVSSAAREGETAAAAFSRLATGLGVVQDAVRLLGGAALENSVPIASLAADLVETAGGAESFAAKFSAYYEAFYTDQEKLAAMTARMRDAFAGLDLAMPAGREGFRALMDGVDLTTEAGQKLYVQLLDLAPAFAELTQAIARTGAAAADAAQDERRAEALRRNAIRAQGQAALDAVAEAWRGLESSETERQRHAAGASLGPLSLSGPEAEKYAAFVTFADAASAELEKIARSGAAAELDGVAQSIKGQMAAAARQLAPQLALDRLRAGDIGAVGALAAADMGELAWTGNAGAFNAQSREIMIRAALAAQSLASAHALEIPDAARLFDSLGAGIGGTEHRWDIKSGLAAQYGIPAQGRLMDAMGGFFEAAVDRLLLSDFTAAGPGLASVRAAGAGYARAASGADIDAYTGALASLDRALGAGRITVDDYAAGIAAVTATLGEAAPLVGDLAAQQARIEAAALNMGRAGLESIHYYFGKIAEQARALAEESAAANDALAQVNGAIGRLTSVSGVFGASAAAAREGFAAGGAEGAAYLSDPATQKAILDASLVAAAAAIGARMVTTADAAAVAKQLSGQFTDKRGAALLLDGLRAYDSASFEKSFTRMNAALGGGRIDESQYIELMGVAFDTYTGFAEEARRAEDAFAQLRRAARSLADALLVDAQRTPLDDRARAIEAERQYRADLAGARGGSLESMRELERSSRTYLDAARSRAADATQYRVAAAEAIAAIRAVERTPTATLDDVLAENRALREEIRALAELLSGTQGSLAANTGSTAKILRRWAEEGLPPTAA